MDTRVTVALFGLGRAGKIHFKNLYNNLRVELKYIVEEYTTEAEKFVVDFRLTNTRVIHSSEAQTVFNDPSLKACIIATPTQTHESLVLSSLRAGKAVFCEKPLANSVEAIAKCYDEAKSRDLPLICSFNRRFDPGVREIYTRTIAGEVGRVQMVKLTSRDSPLPPLEYLKNSNGIYHDCAVHDIDVLNWIYDERPLTVYTTAHSFIKEISDMNDVDTLAIVLKYPNGGIGIVDISRLASFGYDQRLEVFGEKGMLQQHNRSPSNVQFSGENGSTTGRIYHSFPERYAESYVKCLDHFLNVIKGKCPADITKKSTLLATEVVEACEQSLARGQAVTLPL